VRSAPRRGQGAGAFVFFLAVEEYAGSGLCIEQPAQGAKVMFRSSRFIDFNTGRVHVPPMVLIQSLGPRVQQSIEQMLMVFECRVDVWQLGPAVALLKLMDEADDQASIWAHSGYTLLAATFCYFEMIGKIVNAASAGRGTAGQDFNAGFCDVYPKFAKDPLDYSDTCVPDVAQFRDRVRNGLFHLGYTKSHLFIHNQPSRWPEDFMITNEGGERYYLVNPHSLTRSIVEHFPRLISRLRDPSPEAAPLRGRFVDFYVKFHQGRNSTRDVPPNTETGE
jgi:hypothetical protein